jgi:hypothetical protein
MRVLRSPDAVISAFTRVFDALRHRSVRRGALLIRGPHRVRYMGPGSAERCFTLHRVRNTGPRGLLKVS